LHNGLPIPEIPPLPHAHTYFVTSVASVAHSSPRNIKFLLKKFQKTKERSLLLSLVLTHPNLPLCTQNKSQQKAESGRREISFSDMHPKLSKYEGKEEKNIFLNDIQNLKPNESEGRKEREIYFKKKYPSTFLTYVMTIFIFGHMRLYFGQTTDI
jgi:hypothetical protein